MSLELSTKDTEDTKFSGWSTKDTEKTKNEKEDKDMEGKMLYQEESYHIIGAALEVHKNLGSGFSEAVYSDALAIEFSRRKIPYEREKRLIIK